MRFHDLYVDANRLLGRFIYFLGFKGLFQPQREVQTYCLTSTQCSFAVNIELLHIKTRSCVVYLSQTFMQNVDYQPINLQSVSIDVSLCYMQYLIIFTR